jgi:hypothetical protein
MSDSALRAGTVSRSGSANSWQIHNIFPIGFSASVLPLYKISAVFFPLLLLLLFFLYQRPLLDSARQQHLLYDWHSVSRILQVFLY